MLPLQDVSGTFATFPVTYEVQILNGAGAVVAEVVDAIVGDLKRIFALSVVLDGEYGVKDGAASLPMIVGRGGAVKVLEPSLGAEDRKRFVGSAEAVKASVAAAGSK